MLLLDLTPMLLMSAAACEISVVFKPQGPPGQRVANLALRHGWIGGGLALALIGSGEK